MEKSYKFRIYPTKEQEVLIQKTFGCCRFVYNYYLNKRIEAYKNHGETLNFYACSKDLTVLKNEYEWLCEVNAQSLVSSLRDLDNAYKSFFSIGHGFPKFKSKRNRLKSFKAYQGTVLTEKSIKLRKIGFIPCRVSRQVEGRILSATVSQNPSGKYFVSICCTDCKPIQLPKTGTNTGVDLGIKYQAILSDGTKYRNHKFITTSEKKLSKLQRELSRKSKGSKRLEKQRIKVARLHEHIANQRRDAMQKLTTDLIRNYDVICIEDLSASSMMKNHKLAKAVVDVSFYEFKRELEYKAAWYGKTISVVDRFYPSSQLCSYCGAKNPDTKDLSIRQWVCPACGTLHDRDVNAAKNILIEGLRLIA